MFVNYDMQLSLFLNVFISLMTTQSDINMLYFLNPNFILFIIKC